MSLIEISRRALTLTLPNGFEIPIRWYGCFYLLSYILISWRAEVEGVRDSDLQQIIDWALVGGLIGGRLWYLVYRYLELGTPLYYKAFYVWEGGMAFQGGIFGALVAGVWCVHVTKNQKYLGRIMDVLTANAPIGIMFGRLGNFLNEEFMNLIAIPGLNIALPSCLVSSITEGIIPFLILNYTPGIDKKKYVTSCIFFILYSVIRFINDFFRTEETYGPFKLSQYVCLAILSVATFSLLYLNTRSRKR